MYCSENVLALEKIPYYNYMNSQYIINFVGALMFMVMGGLTLLRLRRVAQDKVEKRNLPEN